MNHLHPPNRMLFSAGNLQACELDERDIPGLQDFFVANPEYFIAVNGAPPREDEAQQEFEDRPPRGMPFDKQYMIGFIDDAGSLVGIASILSNFLAERVWHVGLFMVATSLHGTGKASAMYQHLQEWMRVNGAQSIRLGAVVGNQKAERFWQKLGYTEVRRRDGVQTGKSTSTIRVFVKALDGQSIEEYLRLVERDRPDSMLP